MIAESRTFVASLLAAVTVGALFGTGISGGPGAVAASPALSAATPAAVEPAVDSWEFAAAGDMNPSGNTSTSSASGKNAASITASLNDGSLDNFIGLGDFQYDKGTCSALGAWDTLWGGVKARTFWTAGPNHDVTPGVNDDLDRYMDGQCVSSVKSATNTALGRFQDALEWYSFGRGNWHIVVAPTAAWRYNAARAQAMTAEMDADMKAAKAAGKHLAVLYHDPYFTSSTSAHTRFTEAKPWIDVFWANRVKVLLSGSQHNYERTCPVDNADQCVPDGMQQFQVSTGGISLRSFTSDPAYVQRKFSDTWGHLRMSLKDDGSYTWEFRPVHGGMQTDSGSRGPGSAPPGDTVAPTVAATSPAAGATGVAVGANVTGTFSEAMDASTVTPGTFILAAGTTAVTAAVAYDSTTRVATLNPGADLAPGTVYTATIKGGSGGVKDVAGNALATDRVWSFTTASGAASEMVTFTATADSYVASGAAGTNYGTSAVLGVDNSPVEVAYLKFNLSGYAGRTVEKPVLQLRSAGNGSGGTQDVRLVTDDSWTEGGITYNNRPALGTGTLGTFGPTTTNTAYNVPLTPGALAAELGGQLSLGINTASYDGLDLNSREAGSTAAPKLVLTLGSGGSTPGDTTAPTVAATSPAAGATGVAVAADVTGTFSEAMDASTITSSTFTLKTGTTAVPAAIAYNSTTRMATLNPGADLAAGTVYTATIRGGSGGVKDAAGNALAADKTWSFTTASAGGTTSETVTLTATADSYVAGGTAANTNYGTGTVLNVDNSPVEATYLKFDLSAYAGRTVEGAVLQLRSAWNGSGGTQNIKLVTNDSWTEGGITYNNRPALGTGLGTLGPTTTNTTYNIPLTVGALGAELGGQLSLGLDTTSWDGLVLNSREAGSTAAPKLVLTLKK